MIHDTVISPQLQAVCHVRHGNIIELYATTTQSEFIPRFYIVTGTVKNSYVYSGTSEERNFWEVIQFIIIIERFLSSEVINVLAL